MCYVAPVHWGSLPAGGHQQSGRTDIPPCRNNSKLPTTKHQVPQINCPWGARHLHQTSLALANFIHYWIESGSEGKYQLLSCSVLPWCMIYHTNQYYPLQNDIHLEDIKFIYILLIRTYIYIQIAQYSRHYDRDLNFSSLLKGNMCNRRFCSIIRIPNIYFYMR